MACPMATTNLFTDPVFKDGAFTSHDARVRAYALQKTMRAMDLGVAMRAKTYVFWGGRDRSDQALSGGDRLSLRICPRSEVRPALRARSQAQRAARRHLLPHNGV